MKSSNIGGQAVLEGIMMKNRETSNRINSLHIPESKGPS